MNYYTTIILVFIPLAPAFFKSTFLPTIQSCFLIFIPYIICMALLLYFLINWCLLAAQYISVTGINKSSFTEIKNPPYNRNKVTQQLCSYYHDWQEERFETNLRVAYVVETELIVKCAATLLIALIALSVAGFFLDISTADSQQNGAEIVYGFNAMELKNPFSADSLKLAELHTEIRRSKPQSLFVLIGPETTTFNIINENLQQYEEKVKISTYTDPELSPFEFKIALLGG